MRRAMLLAILAFAPLAALVLRFHWLGLPGVWAALGCWLAARTVLLWRRWANSSADSGSRPGGSAGRRPLTGRRRCRA
jgi:Na+-driven multidrug efflux pump